MDVLLVIDMQQGLLRGDPKHELAAVVEGINRLAARVRQRGGCVLFVQHDGPPGDAFEPFTPGWSMLGSIKREASDRVVRKRLNDAFLGTSLQSDLAALGAERVFVAGWATDLCVDATVRSAVALGFRVVPVADCHTVSNRPHLTAERIIEHHNWVWAHLVAPQPVTVIHEADV